MDSSLVFFHQVWQNKYSNERIRITSHVFQFLWGCVDIRNKKQTQITEYDLVDGWNLLDEHK